jgi:biotin transport system substrate-specific component
MKSMAANSVARPQSAITTSTITKNIALIVGASLFVALCAQASIVLPFTPVPLSLVNFAVLLVGLALGSKRGFAALALYLAEGAAGLPVFAHAGGFIHLTGATGGYLIAYPFVAFVAGFIFERGARSFARGVLASIAAELLLFFSGVTWLMILFHQPLATAANWGLYPFFFGEIIKVMAAAGIATRVRAFRQN